MKPTIFSTRRWFVILVMSLLLCGAGTLNAFALPVQPAEPMPDRASLGADQQEADPPTPAAGADAFALAPEPAAPAAVAALDDNLLAYWKLDGNGDDSSASGSHDLAPSDYFSGQWLTEHAPTIQANTSSVRFFESEEASALWSLGVVFGNSSFTLAAWAKRPGTDSADTIMSQAWSTLTDGQSIYFGFQGDNKFRCGFGSGAGAGLVTSSPFEETGWHHWACTYNVGSNLRQIYLDGRLVASDISSVDYLPTSGSMYFLVGARNASPWDQQFNGWIDEARVYNRELSAAEMKVLGQAKQRPIAYWKLDGNGDDSSASGSHDLSIGTGLPSSPSYVSGGAPTAFTNSHHVKLDWLDTYNVRPIPHHAERRGTEPAG